MTRDWVPSAFFSLGVHAMLLVPMVSLGFRTGVKTDVVRGVSSVELELVTSEWVFPEGEEETAAPATEPESWSSDDGALSTMESSLPFQNPAPRYPWLARVNGWQGTVVVQALVAPTGQAASVKLKKSSGFSILDGAALAALRQWRFLPAQRSGGKAVASRVEIPITFRLEQEE